MSNNVRGIFAAGDNPKQNTIDYITMASSGNATDFGNLAADIQIHNGASSNCHSGLEAHDPDERFLVSNIVGSGRAFYVGGINNNPAGEGGSVLHKNLDYFQISTTGNASDYGDLTQTFLNGASASSATRGVVGGGTADNSNAHNVIESYEMASLGNASDFGDLTAARNLPFNDIASSTTRGLFAGGQPDSNVIDYITIASAGDAADFGDLQSGKYLGANCCSNVRGIFGGGVDAPAQMNVIGYVTIASTGDAADFGDLTNSPSYVGATSGKVRGLWMGGSTPSKVDVIQYITIASTGDASDFGDLSDTRAGVRGASNSIRAVCMGGYKTFRSELTTMEYVTIASTGDVTDFGDLTGGRYGAQSASDSHGGL